MATLGAGGVARAAAGVVALAGGQAVIFNRTDAKAQALASELSAAIARFDPATLDACERFPIAPERGRIVAGRRDALDCGCFHAFINCTPVGMSPGPDPDGHALETLAGGHVRLADAVVLDTVYAPEVTPLLADVRNQGGRGISGSAMFTEQARRQFERWTGHRLPNDSRDRGDR